MKIGFVVAQNYWIHLNEIYNELKSHHTVEVYQNRKLAFPFARDRINRYLQRRSLHAFLRRNDVVFFEWAEKLFVQATTLPKQCFLIVRLHRHEAFDLVSDPRVDWSKVDHIIVISEAMERVLVDLHPSVQGLVSTIHNGVNTEKFAPKSSRNAHTLGMLCRISPDKRVYEVILSFNELIRQGYDLRLRIGGEADARTREYAYRVHRLVSRLNLSDRIHFDGYVSNTAEWLNEIDIFLSHSWGEGLQVALLEAMASGCYCLSHYWEGVDEALPPENIYWTDAELVERVAAHCQLTCDEQQVQRERLRGIALKHFDIAHKKVLVRNLLEGIVSEKRDRNILKGRTEL